MALHCVKRSVLERGFDAGFCNATSFPLLDLPRCDDNMAETNSEKAAAQKAIEGLNAKMTELKAIISQRTEEILTLSQEIADLNKAGPPHGIRRRQHEFKEEHDDEEGRLRLLHRYSTAAGAGLVPV